MATACNARRRWLDARMCGGFCDMTKGIPPRSSTLFSPNTPASIALRNCRGVI